MVLRRDKIKRTGVSIRVNAFVRPFAQSHKFNSWSEISRLKVQPALLCLGWLLPEFNVAQCTLAMQKSCLLPLKPK